MIQRLINRRSTKSKRPEPKTLDQAILDFKGALSEDMNATFEKYCASSPPTPNDVVLLTSDINRLVAQKRKANKYVTSMTNILQAIQQYTAIIDTVVGGLQIEIASAVWGVVKISLQIACAFSKVFDDLMALFKDVGYSCPRNFTLGPLYPEAKGLQSALSEYLIVVVRLCKKSMLFFQKSTGSQLLVSITKQFDIELGECRDDLKRFAWIIRDEVSLASNQAQIIETKDAKASRLVVAGDLKKMSQELEMARYERRKETQRRFLNACATYDHRSAWKSARGLGAPAWVFDKDEYKQWRQEKKPSVLWCSGKLGCGKTVLSANVVENLLYLGVAFFFCRYNDSESLNFRTIIGSIARQLFQNVIPEIPDFADRVIGTEVLSADQVLDHLIKLLPTTREYFILIDGIDECDEEDVKLLMDHLRRLLESKIFFRVFCSSRPNVFPWASVHLEPYLRPLNVTIADTNSEIEKYVQSQLEQRVEKGKIHYRNPAIIDDVQQTLLEKAQGMFLWVSLEIETICSQTTDWGIRRALRDLPKDLPATFDRILLRLQYSGFADPSLSKTIFSFIAAAKRPLKDQELQTAISIKLGQKELDLDKFVNDMTTALQSCGSLLVRDEDDLTVQFAHQSVKQHLLSAADTKSKVKEYHMDPITIDIYLGKISVTYLSFTCFGKDVEKRQDHKAPQLNPEGILGTTLPSGDVLTKLALLHLRAKGKSKRDISHQLEETAQKVNSKFQMQVQNHFLDYATEFWLQHSKYFEPSKIKEGDVYELWKHLVDGDSKLPWTKGSYTEYLEYMIQNEHWALITRTLNLLAASKKNVLKSGESPDFTKLELLLKLLPKTRAVNPTLAATYDRLLIQAASVNESGIVRLLLERRVNLSIEKGQMSLERAAEAGFLDIVQLLLENGPELNAQRAFDVALRDLRWQQKPANEKIFRFLLAQGANFNAQEGRPLMSLSSNPENENILRLFLDQEVDTEDLGNALVRASSEPKHGNIVRLLLDKGINVIAQSIRDKALQAAMPVPNNDEVISLLMHHGAGPQNSIDPNSALPLASSTPNESDVIECSHDHRPETISTSPAVDPSNASNVPADTSLLHLKVMGDLEKQEILQTELGMLWEYQDDLSKSIGIQAFYYGNWQQSAAYLHPVNILLDLLDKGADVNEQGGFYCSTLQAAAASEKDCYSKVVELLRRGAKVNIQGGIFGSALQAAACTAKEAVLHQLLEVEVGANVNAQGGPFGNALQAAALYCDETVVRLMLQRGADADAQGGRYGNALQAAAISERDSTEKVQLLLEYGANPSAPGGVHGSSLQAAATSNKKNDNKLELLLDREADVNIPGGYYGSALQAAVCAPKNSTSRVELLLERKADVNARGGKFGSALQAAAACCNRACVELLLKHGADVLSEEGCRNNALAAAIINKPRDKSESKDIERIIRLLLKKGAELDAPRGWYEVALASENPYEKSLKLVRKAMKSRHFLNSSESPSGAHRRSSNTTTP